MPEEQKRESGVQRFIGFSPEDQKIYTEHFKEIFKEQQDPLISFKKYEREKTEGEAQYVTAILERMPEFIRRFGGNPLNLNMDHVHMLDNGKMDDDYRKKIEGKGACYLARQELMFMIDSGNDLDNACHLVHELIHFNSFQSIEPVPTKGEKVFSSRRVGLEIFSNAKDKMFFEDFNEAVTEELAKRFDKEYFELIPRIADQVKNRNDVRTLLADKDDIQLVRTKESGEIEWRNYAYSKERANLNKLIDQIFETNKDNFKDREDVFKVFAEAALSGNIMPLARLVEETLGKGAFRQLGTKK